MNSKSISGSNKRIFINNESRRFTGSIIRTKAGTAEQQEELFNQQIEQQQQQQELFNQQIENRQQQQRLLQERQQQLQQVRQRLQQLTPQQ